MKAFALAIALLSFGCVSKYKKFTERNGGYEDRQLGDGTMIAEFYGTEQTSTKLCIDFALKRASEVCSPFGKIANVIDINSTAVVPGSGFTPSGRPEARVKYTCK